MRCYRDVRQQERDEPVPTGRNDCYGRKHGEKGRQRYMTGRGRGKDRCEKGDRFGIGDVGREALQIGVRKTLPRTLTALGQRGLSGAQQQTAAETDQVSRARNAYA